ncbi:ARM repeat superfamily protein [Zea mays]|uniref:ARM repeat superfamily protein n=1 Tax=Zea mays TaxID=4577 RepID=A0A1D6HWZ2_MAIZE|nr:ARM repeat superfamily protein [Zea mays]
MRVAAATYLKNFTRRNLETRLCSSEVYKEFRDQLAQALLRVEPAILRVLIEVFRQVVEKDFVKDNLWPELIPQLKLVIQSSNLISPGQHPEWNTINALTVLQSVVRPFQVRSYMPSRVKQILPSFCKDMFRILDSLNFNSLIEDGSTMKLKIAKRCLIIFCALVTRHRKHTDN